MILQRRVNMNPIIMHVNYCEQGQTLDEICQKAIEWGFDGVEFRGKRSGIEEAQEDYLNSLASAVEKSGLKNVIFGYYPHNLMSTDRDVRAEEVEKAVNFFRSASQKFKLTVCNVFSGALVNSDKSIPNYDYDRHGSFAATEEQWLWAASAYSVIGREAEKLGIKLAFETHMNYIHDLPGQAAKLAAMVNSPAVGVNLDYGNAVYFKKAPSIKEAIEVVGDKLYYVHLKNSIGVRDGSRFPVGLGDGEINHREYLKLLKKKGYTGPIAIEGPRPGDREYFARQDLAYFKMLMEEI